MKNITQYSQYIDKDMNKINLYPKVTLLKTLSGMLLLAVIEEIGIFSFSELLFLLSILLLFYFPELSPSVKLPIVLKGLLKIWLFFSVFFC